MANVINAPVGGCKNSQTQSGGYPVVEVINGVYTFKNLRPEIEHFGLWDNDYYHLCLQLLEIVGRYQYSGFIREALDVCKADKNITNGEEAAESALEWLIWEGCIVKWDLLAMRDFLPNKADRKAIFSWDSPDCFLYSDGELWIEGIDEDHEGQYFNYDGDNQFSWTLSGMDYFAFAYDYEVNTRQ